jgi:hypothetical protein
MEKQEQLVKLSILPVNKTVVFYSPIEGKDVLVRTGTIPDGSCFYHSLLHSYSKEYVSMDEHGRRKLVSRLRGSLASKVDRDRWEKLSGGLVAKIPFQEHVNILLTDFYRHVKNGKPGRTKIVRKVIRAVMKDKHDKNTYELIAEMLPVSDFEKHILPKTYDGSGDEPIKLCKEKLVQNSEEFYKGVFAEVKGIDEKRVDFCLNKMKAMVQAIADQADNVAFAEYIGNLKDTSIVVDRYTISMVANRFNRDIFFLDARSRMPYREGGTDHIKKRKTIILMWTGGVHYEVVGRLLPGNRIQREFSRDDPLVERIRMYLCNPENVAETYPNLIPYLPKEHRSKVGMASVSRSQSESYSASDYEDSSSDEFEESDDFSSDSDSFEKKHRSPSPPPKRRQTRRRRKKSSTVSSSPKSDNRHDKIPSLSSSVSIGRSRSPSHSPSLSRSPSHSPSPKKKTPSPKKEKRKHRHKKERSPPPEEKARSPEVSRSSPEKSPVAKSPSPPKKKKHRKKHRGSPKKERKHRRH